MKKTNGQERRIRKKNIYILLVISAILIGHFALQMSFIENQNREIVESFGETQPPSGQKIQAGKIDVAENNLQKAKEPDVAATQRIEPEKKSQPMKVLQKNTEQKSQLQSETIKVVLKKESKVTIKSERLRRAEKILTGF